MNLHITGRHIEVTQGLRDHITEKFSHLKKFFEHLPDNSVEAHVVLLVEHGESISEATMHIPHQSAVHAKAESSDMFASIDVLVDKIKAQVMKHKSKELSERDHQPKHGRFGDAEI